MGAYFTTLFAKIAAVVAWFSALFVAIFVALWDLIKDAFSWLFEQIMKVAVSAVSGVDVSAFSAYANGVAGIPSEILNILALLGVGSAIAIITAAIGLRLVLQLIPFTRLGS